MARPHLNDDVRSELHAILDDLVDRFNTDPVKDAGSGSLQFGPKGEGLLLVSFDARMTDHLLRSVHIKALVDRIYLPEGT